MAPLEWYYAKNNMQHGPVSAAELKQLADRGELGPGDLVWREGMEDWIPAKKVKGLFDDNGPAAAPKPVTAPPKAAPPRRAPAAFGRSATAFARSRQRPSRHVFDLVLDFVRAQFTSLFIESTAKMFTVGGHYGLYAAMAVLFVFSLLLGVKINQVNTILYGMATVVVLLVLQYAASRFLGALERLNRSTPGQMSSTAFLDCYALLNMLFGVVALLGLAVWAVQTGPLSLVLPAVALFIWCQYVAILALNPDSLNLTIVSETSAGEEAIGIFSFLMKLSLQLVPVAFGVGVVWGALILLHACLLMFAPPDDPEIMEYMGPVVMLVLMTFADSNGSEEAMRMLPAHATAIRASLTLILFAALPFLTYISFLVYYLTVDVIRAILSLPRKLDTLAEQKKDAEP